MDIPSINHHESSIFRYPHLWEPPLQKATDYVLTFFGIVWQWKGFHKGCRVPTSRLRISEWPQQPFPKYHSSMLYFHKGHLGNLVAQKTPMAMAIKTRITAKISEFVHVCNSKTKHPLQPNFVGGSTFQK